MTVSTSKAKEEVAESNGQTTENRLGGRQADALDSTPAAAAPQEGQPQKQDGHGKGWLRAGSEAALCLGLKSISWVMRGRGQPAGGTPQLADDPQLAGGTPQQEVEEVEPSQPAQPPQPPCRVFPSLICIVEDVLAASCSMPISRPLMGYTLERPHWLFMEEAELRGREVTAERAVRT